MSDVSPKITHPWRRRAGWGFGTFAVYALVILLVSAPLVHRRSDYVLGQWVLNGLEVLDLTGNWLTWGDEKETISARIGRAREKGVQWVVPLCSGMTFFQGIFTGDRQDHCTYALSPNGGIELFDLNTGRLRQPPGPTLSVQELSQ